MEAVALGLSERHRALGEKPHLHPLKPETFLLIEPALDFLRDLRAVKE